MGRAVSHPEVPLVIRAQEHVAAPPPHIPVDGLVGRRYFNRYAVRHHGRTALEYDTGHKTKLPVACFGETVLWKKKRTSADLNKHDVA